MLQNLTHYLSLKEDDNKYFSPELDSFACEDVPLNFDKLSHPNKNFHLIILTNDEISKYKNMTIPLSFNGLQLKSITTYAKLTDEKGKSISYDGLLFKNENKWFALKFCKQNEKRKAFLYSLGEKTEINIHEIYKNTILTEGEENIVYRPVLLMYSK